MRNLTVILLFIILGVGSFYLIKDAATKVQEKEIHSDTITSIKQITQPTVTMKEYVPYEVKDTVFIKNVQVPAQYIPGDDIKQLQSQVRDLGQKLFATRKYRDSILLRDTSGLNVGRVNIDDEITENSIKDRKVAYQLKFPEKITTITNTVAAPKRTQVFTGLEGQYTQPLVPQVGVGVIVKSKQDNILRIGVGGQFAGTVQPYIGIGYYKLISFRKK